MLHPARRMLRHRVDLSGDSHHRHLDGWAPRSHCLRHPRLPHMSEWPSGRRPRLQHWTHRAAPLQPLRHSRQFLLSTGPFMAWLRLLQCRGMPSQTRMPRPLLCTMPDARNGRKPRWSPSLFKSKEPLETGLIAIKSCPTVGSPEWSREQRSPFSGGQSLMISAHLYWSGARAVTRSLPLPEVFGCRFRRSTESPPQGLCTHRLEDRDPGAMSRTETT